MVPFGRKSSLWKKVLGDSWEKPHNHCKKNDVVAISREL